MATFTGNPFSNFYKRILQISQTTNTGVDSTVRSVESGDGSPTSVSLSKNVAQVQPQATDTTGAFLVNNQGGSSILSVDTTNS